MNAAPVLSLLLLAAPLTALAQSEPLDLKLKDNTTFSGDPPGTYYGDHSGPASADADRPGSELDDGKAHLHGSFTTGVGYSSGRGGGSSTYNAADLNISKAFTSDSGRTSVMSVDLHVSKSDGPGYYGDYGYGYGPGPYFDRRHGPRTASGAAIGWSSSAGDDSP